MQDVIANIDQKKVFLLLFAKRKSVWLIIFLALLSEAERTVFITMKICVSMLILLSVIGQTVSYNSTSVTLTHAQPCFKFTAARNRKTVFITIEISVSMLILLFVKPSQFSNCVLSGYSLKNSLDRQIGSQKDIQTNIGYKCKCKETRKTVQV